MEAYRKAILQLEKASSPHGFLASTLQHDNYKRVWTRDGVVNGLAALLTKDSTLIKTFRTTLETIFTHQHASGFFPSNVSEDGAVSYGGTVGRVDNVPWALIGLFQYTIKTGDESLALKFKSQIIKAVAIMDAWEFNGKHLMYVPQSGDWADEYIQHGYVLFDQLLRVWALRLMAKVCKESSHSEKIAGIEQAIKQNFRRRNDQVAYYAPNLKHQMAHAPTEFWLLGFNPARIYSQFDLQANALALLLNMGSKEEDQQVLQYLSKLQMQYNSLLPSYHPPITDHDWEMKELSNNYAYTFRNRPGEFHNGGLWPVWNGFACAASMHKGDQQLAKVIYAVLETSVEANHWEFNECLNGETHLPAGVPYCTWSAGGVIIAHAALQGNHLEF